VIPTLHVDWFALSPSLSLLAAAGILLLGAVLTPSAWRKPFSAGLCAAAYVTSLVFAALVFSHSEHGQSIIGSAIRRDQFAALAQMIAAGSGLVAVGISYSERWRETHIGEYYALLAAAGAGMAFFVQADNLMTLFLGLEWFSITLYIMCAIDSEIVGSLEAGLKYLVVGGFGSAVLLFGSALVYGSTGEINFEQIGATAHSHDALYVAGLAMLIAGLGFKSSSAPFHMWTPDVYEGAPTPVTSFMAAATKTVALLVMLRVLVVAFPAEAHIWTIAVAVLCCASLAIGNLAALVQRRVKRILAYSSISHAGFMLIAIASDNELGAKALFYYLIPYAAMSLGAFAVVAARERELGTIVTLDNLAGFGWERPFLGSAMWVFMLGFAGFPFTGGFFGKFFVFSAAYEHGWVWLIIVGVVATAVSLYYYLGIIRAMYLRSSAELQLAPVGGSPPRELLLQASVAACVFVTIASFFAVQPIVDLATDAAKTLPF
jgi:NADH-quinone oxidoreductase subunit N